MEYSQCIRLFPAGILLIAPKKTGANARRMQVIHIPAGLFRIPVQSAKIKAAENVMFIKILLIVKKLKIP